MGPANAGAAPRPVYEPRALNGDVREALAGLLPDTPWDPTLSTESAVREVSEMLTMVGFMTNLRCKRRRWCASVPKLQAFGLRDGEAIFQRLHAHQNPERCAEARFLVFHDDRTISGFGWNAYLLFRAFLQAFVEDRVLVEAASIDARYRQHWCSDPPYSLKCYFRPWSRCELPGSGAGVLLADLAALPHWRSGGLPAGRHNCTCREPAVIWRTSVGNGRIPFPLLAAGRYWWYAAMVRVIMQPLPWLQHAANQFLSSRGLAGAPGKCSQVPQRPFVVAAVRRGNKSSEVPYVPMEEFTNQLERLRAAYGTSDVLIQTETEGAVEELRQWCVRQRPPFRLHYTENRRPGFDSFNSNFNKGRTNLTEEGRIAVLNLLVGSAGLALLGSLHSAWLKIMPAFMVARQRRAVLVLGLAKQDLLAMGSYTGPEAGAQQLLSLGEVFRPYGVHAIWPDELQLERASAPAVTLPAEFQHRRPRASGPSTFLNLATLLEVAS